MKANFQNLQKVMLLLVAILFFSCSKNDATATDEPAQKYRLKERITNGQSTAFYTYNNRNQVTKASSNVQNFSYNYEYDSNGFLTRFEGKDAPAGASSLNQVTTYTNDSQGKVLTKIITFSPTDKRKTEYTYTNGFLTETNDFSRNNTDTAWIPTYKSELVNNSSGFAVSTITRQYNSVTLLWTLYVTADTVYNSANLVTSSLGIRNGDGAEFKSITEYDASGTTTTKSQNFSKANPSAAFIKYYDGTFTIDNVKPVAQDYMKARVPGDGNPNSLFTTYQIKNSKVLRFSEVTGVPTTTVDDIYTYEYNKNGYVTKTFRNGTLETTYVLELAN